MVNMGGGEEWVVEEEKVEVKEEVRESERRHGENEMEEDAIWREIYHKVMWQWFFTWKKVYVLINIFVTYNDREKVSNAWVLATQLIKWERWICYPQQKYWGGGNWYVAAKVLCGCTYTYIN